MGQTDCRKTEQYTVSMKSKGRMVSNYSTSACWIRDDIWPQECPHHGQAKKMYFLSAALQGLVLVQRGAHGVLGLFRILLTKPCAAVFPLFPRNVWALVDEAEQRR